MRIGEHSGPIVVDGETYPLNEHGDEWHGYTDWAFGIVRGKPSLILLSRQESRGRDEWDHYPWNGESWEGCESVTTPEGEELTP